jgi:hypothetical protein
VIHEGETESGLIFEVSLDGIDISAPLWPGGLCDFPYLLIGCGYYHVCVRSAGSKMLYFRVPGFPSSTIKAQHAEELRHS